MYKEMKKELVTAVAMIVVAASAAVAQTAESDTLITVTSPREVTVSKMLGSTVVTIKGSADDDRFHYSYWVSADTVTDMPVFNFPFAGSVSVPDNRVVRSFDFFRGFYIGILFPQSDRSLLKTSMEAGINQIAGYRIRRRGAEFSVGVGFGYRQTNVSDAVVTDKSGDALVFVPAPEDAVDRSSNIRSWAIHVPVLYTQRIWRTFGFSFGVVANFNFYTTASSEYMIGDTKYSKTVKGLHQRVLTPDLLFTVGSINNAGIYVKWSPVKAFKSVYGPAYSNLSVGVSFAF